MFLIYVFFDVKHLRRRVGVLEKSLHAQKFLSIYGTLRLFCIHTRKCFLGMSASIH